MIRVKTAKNTSYITQKRKNVSLLLKYVTAICAFSGVLLSLLTAQEDGYSAWWKRLLFFTQQSNLWIGVNSITLAILQTLERTKNRKIVSDDVYIRKYIFTVSITITGITFCALLAPFCDKSYKPWTTANDVTHVIVPLLAIIDFFVDDYTFEIKKKHIFFTLIPPVVYFSLTSVLCILKFEFWRGQNYPYFFMDYYSKAGLFGFSSSRPYIGCMYWYFAFTLLMLLVALLYYKLKRQASNR